MTRTIADSLAGGLAFAAAGLSDFAFAQDGGQTGDSARKNRSFTSARCILTLIQAAGTMSQVQYEACGVEGGPGGDFHICPMHPDVVSNQAGTCPKCNMKLVKSAPPETSEYIVRIKTNPAPPKAGEKVKLQFTIFHPVTEKQIKEFNILHDMPFHLFVVSQDFEVFQHIHPDKQPDGSFTIETDLPKAGYYKIFCDFFPAGGMPQVTHHNLVTAGYNGDLISSQAQLKPDNRSATNSSRPSRARASN